MPTLLLFVLVFAALVIVHEGGHFFAARLGHVDVDEFGIGLPPRFLTMWRNKGTITINETLIRIPRNFELPFDWYGGIRKEVVATYDQAEDGLVLRTVQLLSAPTNVMDEPQPVDKAVYPPPPQRDRASALANLDGQALSPRPSRSKSSRAPGAFELRGIVTDVRPGMAFTLNMLPLGGFVRPRGENDPNVPGGLANASPWTRLGVLLAGPFMNILAGVLIFSFMFMSSGVPDPSVVYLESVLPNSPAATAGFKTGDIIVSINGTAVQSSDQVHNLIYSSLDKPIVVVLTRDGAQQTLTVTPLSNRTAQEGAMGVGLANPVHNATFLSALRLGFQVTGAYIHELITLPARIIQNQAPAGSARFIGLKGMYDFMNQAVLRDAQSRTEAPIPGPSGTPSQQRPTNYTLALIATLSLSLGFFNLLPIPALDGGRILFLLPELIFRRRVPPNVENTVHAVGMIALLLLMLVINVMDFVNPVTMKLP